LVWGTLSFGGGEGLKEKKRIGDLEKRTINRDKKNFFLTEATVLPPTPSPFIWKFKKLFVYLNV